MELRSEPKLIKWDALGLCQMRREGDELLTLTSRDFLLQRRQTEEPRHWLYGRNWFSS